MPEIFQAHGYETFNQGKDDYNFTYKRADLYTLGGQSGNLMQGWKGKETKGKPAWSIVPEGKPWFGQIQLKGGKGKPAVVEDKVTSEQITLPPYFPNEQIFIDLWLDHYNNMRLTDKEVGAIIKQLEDENLLENTIVFVFSDHGNNRSLRAKQFCYDNGLHVPLMIFGAGIEAQASRPELVSGLDISATTLALAGIEIPAYFQGADLFADDYTPAEYVVSARDRCDYTIDRIRSVRSDQYRYIHNGLTDRPLLQPQYRDIFPTTKRLRELNKSGEIDPVAKEVFFGPRPQEELYDITSDPHQVNNLAKDPAFSEIVAAHRKVLEEWITMTGDKGQQPESEAGLKACLKRWKGKCVNPEFAAVKEQPGSEGGEAGNKKKKKKKK